MNTFSTHHSSDDPDNDPDNAAVLARLHRNHHNLTRRLERALPADLVLPEPATLDPTTAPDSPHPSPDLPTTPYPQHIQFGTFTELLDWLAATPTTRLIHRTQLRWIATEIEILQLATSSTQVASHNLTNAYNLALALDHALALDFSRNLDLARNLANDLAHARNLARKLAQSHGRHGGYAHDLDRDIANAFAHAHALDRDRDIANALVVARALNSALIRALNLARDRTRDHGRVVEICALVCKAVVRAGITGLLHNFNDPEAATNAWRIMATISATEHSRLHHMLDDFTEADLREADLNGLDLIGVRWSRTMTRWPFMDEKWIMLASDPLPNGLYVIRAEKIGDDAPVAPVAPIPDPVTV